MQSPRVRLILASTLAAFATAPALAYEIERVDSFLGREFARTGLSFRTLAIRHLGGITYLPMKSVAEAMDLCLDKQILEVRAVLADHPALFEENFSGHLDDRVFGEVRVELPDFRLGALDRSRVLGVPREIDSRLSKLWESWDWLRISVALDPTGSCMVTPREKIVRMIHHTLNSRSAELVTERLSAAHAVATVRKLSSLLPPPSGAASLRREKSLLPDVSATGLSTAGATSAD